MSEQDLVKQEELVGKIVVNMRAEKVGEVKGVAYDAKGTKELIISSAEGVDKVYPIDQAVAIKDVVLLDENRTSSPFPKTQAPPTSQTSTAHVPTFPTSSPPIPRFPTPGAQAPAAVTKACQWCGRENRLQSKFCVQCGKPL